MIYHTQTRIDEDWFRQLMAGAHPMDKAALVYRAFCAMADVAPNEQEECLGWLARHLDGHDSAAAFLDAADRLRAKDAPSSPDRHNLSPGDKVRFHPIIGGKHDGNVYRVRHANGQGVWLEGKAGMVAWEAVTPVEESEAK